MDEDESPYCSECSACGEDGCCSALKCAYNNMVIKSTGLYCEDYFKDIEFAYEMFKAYYDESKDKEMFDTIYDKVYK
jgi:hypothetical protein